MFICFNSQMYNKRMLHANQKATKDYKTSLQRKKKVKETLTNLLAGGVFETIHALILQFLLLLLLLLV